MPFVIRRSSDRGHANQGWLDTYHTFSFADYRDPEWMQFGHLRVLNQDRVKPGMGFGTHGHRDMEIVSLVLDGVLEHKDSMGNGSQIRPGDVQLMSAGRGVTHSEFNGSDEDEVHFLQMWILPRQRGSEPRYEERHYEDEERRGRLRLVVSPGGADGSLSIDQDARLYAGRLDAGHQWTHPLSTSAWLHVATGKIQLNGETLEAGDGAGIRDVPELSLEAQDDTELVLWELA